MVSLVFSRFVSSVVTIFIVATIVFVATEVLPGDVATAVLGREATPKRLAALRAQLELDRQAQAEATAQEDAVRARELEDRRRKALAEAEAIRNMMSAPKKVLVAKNPEEPAAAVRAKPSTGRKMDRSCWETASEQARGAADRARWEASLFDGM